MGSVIKPDVQLFISHARMALNYGVSKCKACGLPYVQKTNKKYCNNKCYVNYYYKTKSQKKA